MKYSNWFRNMLPLLLILGLLLTACDNQEDQTKAGDAGNEITDKVSSPVQGGSINIAVQDDPKIMNPLYATDRITLTVNQSLYAPLFYMDNGKKVYALAERAYASKDYKTYFIKLREGLTWHDGKSITADDIVFTVNQIIDETQNSPFRSQYVFDGQPVRVVKIDELTVKFVLPAATPSFEGALLYLYPIPKHIYQGEKDIAHSSKNDHPIGSGPFKYKEYAPGEHLTLERFEDYYDGAAYLDTISYQIMDPDTADQALREGVVQMSLINNDEYETLSESGEYNLVTYADGRLQYMVFNMNTAAMKKKEVREAIAYALDKEEMIRISYLSSRFADPASSIFTPDTLYHTSEVRTYDYNPEKSKQLLEQADVSNLKIRLAYVKSSNTQMNQALYIQQKLKKVGIKVELKPMEASAYEKKKLDQNNTDFELSLAGYILGPDPVSYESLYKSSGVYNESHAENKDLDTLWERASVEVDSAVRQKLYVQIQQKIAKELQVLPIAYTKSVIAVSKGYGGLEEATAQPIVLFRDLSKIYFIK